MAECGNMPDWHPYNAPPGGRAVAPPSGPQGASAGHMFISSLSPPAHDSVNLTPDRHQTSKHQSEPSYGRNYVGAQNPGGGCSTSTSLPSGVHMTPLPGCVSHYAGSSSTRNPMMDGLGSSMDPRMVQVGGLSDDVAHRNGQMSFPVPSHPSSAGVNVNAGPAGMQNSPVGPMSPGRQAGYGACKAPCCHPDTAIAYQHWDKYGHYHGPPNAPSSYRDNIRAQSSYPAVDQRRYMPEMNIRKDCIDKDLEPAGFNVEHRRNYDYKYSRKEPVVPRNYPPAANGMIQNYPMQNYNCPNEYQKCPYSVKDYMRRGSSGGSVSSKSSAMLKYQEQQQSVIVQQKYSHAKQMQYQNGPVVMPSAPTSSSGNMSSSIQNSYYNATQMPRDLSRDYPRDYSQEQTANRMSQPPPSSHVHGSFSKYQAYHQKIAMQRYSMENHLRSYSRIPGYQSHPKYQECVMRYRELLRLQQTVDYQSVLQEAPKVPSPTNAVPPVAPINLQFDQNGVLINSNYIPGNYPGLHSGMNPPPQTESADPSATVRMPGSGPSMDQRGQFVDHSDQSMNLTRDVDQQPHQGAVVSMHESAEHYYMPPGKNSHTASYEVGRLGNAPENLDTLNVDVDVTEPTKTSEDIATSATSTTVAPSMPIVSTTSTIDYKNSKDFADKPELDVRQFLATWDESEDEDAAAASVIATSLAERFDDQVFSSESPTAGTTTNDTIRKSQDDKDDPGAATSASGGSPGTDSTSEIDIGTNENSPINNAESVTIANEIQCIRTDDGDEIPTIHIVDNLEAGTDLEKIHTVFGSLASSVLNPISIGEASSELIGEAGKSETIVLFEQENGVCTKTLEFSVSSETAGTEVVEGVIASIIESSTVETPELQQSTETPKSPYEPPQEATNSPNDRHLPVQENSPTTTSSASTTSATSSSGSSKTNETSLRKQNSFTSDESHNPDDISLPDLQTSECTPISTTLNTPIHSDSEESSEHVSDLTTSTNPIEIIQNSPIISFTHSPIKIEPYEQLEARMGRSTRQRAAVEQLQRHDSLDFDFDREVAVGENTKYTEASETSDSGGVEGLEPEVSRTEDSLLLADIQEHPEKNSYSEKSVVEPVTETEFYRTADPLVGMAHITKTVSEDRGDEVQDSRPTDSGNDENDGTNRDSPVDRILDNDDLDKCPTMMEPEDDFNRSSDLEKLCDMSLDASCMMPLISGEECDEPRIPVAPIEDGDCFAKMMNDALPQVDLDVSESSSDERLGKPDEDMWGDVRYVDKHLDANFASTNDRPGKNEIGRSKKIFKIAKTSSRSVRSSPTRRKRHSDRMVDETSQNELERRLDLSESEDEEGQESSMIDEEIVVGENDRRDKSCASLTIEQQKLKFRERKFEDCAGEESRRNRGSLKRRSSRDTKDSEENSRMDSLENSQREKRCVSPAIEQETSSSRARKFEDCSGEESRRNRDSMKRRSSREIKDFEENSRTDDSENFQREKRCASPAIEQQKLSSKERNFEDCAREETRRNRESLKRRLSPEANDFEEDSRMDDCENFQRENNCVSSSIEQQKLSRERKFEDCPREETRRNRDSSKRRLSREAKDFEENSWMDDCENSQRERNCASPSIRQQKSSNRERKFDDCLGEETRRNRDSSKRRVSLEANDFEENSRIDNSDNSQREKNCASPSIEQQKSSSRERKFEDCDREETRRNRDSSKRRLSREANDFEENNRMDDCENSQRERNCASPSIEQQKSSNRERKFDDCPGEETRRNRDSSKRRLSRESKDFEENSRMDDLENSQREKNCPSPSIEQQKSSSRERKFEDCPGEETRRNRDSSKRRLSRETKDFEENSRIDDSKNSQRENSYESPSIEQQTTSTRERKFEDCPGEEPRRNRDSSKRRSSRETKDFDENSRTDVSENSQREKNCASPSIEQQKSSTRERKFEDCPGEDSRRNRDSSKRRSSRETKNFEENSWTDDSENFQREKNCASPSIEQQKSTSKDRKFEDCPGEESRRIRDSSKRRSSRETKDFDENSRTDDSENFQREKNCASPSIEQQKSTSKDRKFEDCPGEESRRIRDSFKRRSSRETKNFEENSWTDDSENSQRENNCASLSIEQQRSSSKDRKFDDCPGEDSRRIRDSSKRRSSRETKNFEENSWTDDSENSQRENNCASLSIEQQKSSSKDRKFDDCPGEDSRRNRDSSKRRSSRETKDFDENSRTDFDENSRTENSQREKNCASPSIEQQKSSSKDRKFDDCPGEDSRRNRDSSKRRSSRETKDSEETTRPVDSEEESKNPLTKSYTTKHRDSNVEIQVANFNVKIHDNEVIRNETIGSKAKSSESSDDGLDAIEIKINLSRGDVNRRTGKQLQEKFVEEDRRVVQESDVPESSPQPRETTAGSSTRKRCRRRRRSMPDGYEPKKSKRTEDDRPEAAEHYTPKKITRARRHKVRRSMDDELLFKPDRSRKETPEERNFHLEMAKAFNLPWPRDETPETCDSSSSLLTKDDKDYLDGRNNKNSSTKPKSDSRSDKHVKETRTLPSPSYNSTETSSTLDFDNFDVAPHHSSDTDPEKPDSSSETRYSRVKRTRLEDRDRYRNPSSYGASFDELSSLDAFEINLNTVPIYTTKDGRVTYSPNRNYTYRTLIMEARQREGYPALRKLHYPRHLSSRGHYREAALRKIYKRRQDERTAHEKKRRSGEYHPGKFKRPAPTRHHQEESEPRIATRTKKHDNRRRETRLPSEMSEFDDQTRDYVEEGATSKNRSVESSGSYKAEVQGHPKTIQCEESPGTRRPECVRKDDQPDVSRNIVSSFKPGAAPKNVVEEKLRSPKHYPSRDDNCLVSKIFQGQELEISARKVSSTVGQERAKNEREACVRASRFFQDSPSSTKTPMASPLINLEKRPIGWDLEQDCQTALSDSGLESSTTYVEASKESRRIQRWKNSFVNRVETTKTIYNTPIDDYTEAIDLSREKLPVEEDRRFFEDEKTDLPMEENEEVRLEIGSEEINVAEAALEVEEPNKNAEKIEKPMETERRRITAESALPTEPLDEDALKNDRVSEIVKSLDLAITRLRPSLKEPRIGLEREILKPIRAEDDRDAPKPAASIFLQSTSFLRKPSEAPSRRASSDGVESRDSRSEFFRGPIVSEMIDSKIDEEFFRVERIVESENVDSQTATSEAVDRAPSPENFQASCKDFLIDTSTSFSSCMKLPALVSALPTESESSRLEDTSTRFASESMDFKDDSDSPRSEFVPFTSHGTIDSSAMDNDTTGRDSFFCSIAENATNPSVDCSIDRNSVDSLEIYATSDCRSKESSPAAPILSFSGQIQSDSRNSDSLTKSPPNLSCEDSVSKIVVNSHERSKSPVRQPIENSMNSSICQPIENSMNSSICQPIENSMTSSICQPIENSMNSSISQPIDSSTNDSIKSSEPIEQETSSYPKIPKMIIRNVRSRPGSPSAVEEDETEDTKNFTREQKVFEVEIKLDRDTIERDSSVECKVPKMKIKLEDKQQPMILEAPKPSLESAESKNVPKVKIRKVRRSSKSRSPIRVGKLSRQSSENEIPVEVADNAENSNGSYKFTLVDKSSSTSQQSGRAERVEEDSRHDRIPKLTIKKQEVVAIGSGYSSSQLKKRRSRSPGESGSKKQRRSAGKHGKKDETRSRERRNNSSDSNEGNTDSQSPSEKIPKVIIKRTSPSAEFKCELSKVGREAITKDSKWQPEVKLQRSWVLDCMAKEPGGGKLALKMLETSSESGLKRNSDGSSRRNGEWKRSTSDSTSRKTSSSVDSKARRRSDCEFNEDQARYSNEQRARTVLLGNSRSKSFDDNINANRGVSRAELDCSSAMSEVPRPSCKMKSNRTLKILNDDDFDFGNEEKDEVPDERQDRSEADSRKPKKSAKSGFEEPESSVIKLDSSDESQTTIEILPASPLDSQPESLDTTDPSSEVEQSIRNGAMGKLYSDEAIPTQFELELDIVDNSTMDSLDVPVPMPGESSLEEESARSEHFKPYRSSDDDENASATDIGFDKFVYDADTRSVSLKKPRRSTDNDRRTICCSDSLVKEVLAAKETLKRCLTKSKSAVVRTKMKPRTKTAAEKKQGAGFDFVGLAAYAKTSRCNVEERAVFQDTVKGAKSSEVDGKARSERDENLCGTDGGESKLEKTRESSGKDRHRKSWSSESRPSGRSRDELAASGTSSRSAKRSSTSSTEVGSTRTKGGRIVENESLGENSRSKSSSEKSSTNRSFKVNEKSADRIGSGSKATDIEDSVKKIKSYKIPKISRSRDKIGGEEAAVEEKRKSPSPAKMPVLEPQVDIDFELAVSDRDTSRSPPVITKQEDRRAESDLPKKIEDNVSSDKLDSITKQRDSEAVTFADIVSQLAYHEKATIRHRRYCNLCERWFPSTIRHERHLSGYQHRHTELTQRRTVHALFMLFTGKPCPRLLPASIVRTDCLPGEPTPLQIAVQDVAISLEDGARVKPNKDVSSRDE